MKKFIPLFLVSIFTFTAYSCQSDDDAPVDNVDYDTYPVVYDLRNVNFELINNTYMITRTMDNPMFASDVILIYMQDGNTNNGAPIWRPLPITLYFEGGDELDYTYDFSQYDFAIYAGGTFPLGGTSYINNKTFRIVFVPASPSNKGDNQVDYNDYESVIKHFNIDDTNVGTL